MEKNMYQWAEQIFPICRSITGKGVDETLDILSNIHPITKHYVPSGTKVLDWTVPKEWKIEEAYIQNSEGKRIVDFRENNLHVVGYSAPVNKKVSLSELKKIIYTLPDQPELIPYVTSYYKEMYGFCMSENQKKTLQEDTYHIVIKSEHFDGNLTYGEIVIPGSGLEEKEVFFSTYICHPSMANNECSGPVVVLHLAKWLASLKSRRYTYRIVLIPETIGSITYLSENLNTLKKKMVAGFNISCVGDNRTYSYISSRYGNTLADKVVKNVLYYTYPQFKSYSFLDRGSDERQYNAPGIDLPLCTICRSKYGEYTEYHTSADNLDLISEEGLKGALHLIQECVSAIEGNYNYKIKCLGEPQLGKRGLYPTVSFKGSAKLVKDIMNFIAYADGKNDLIDISNIIGISIKQILEIAQKIYEQDLVERVS